MKCPFILFITMLLNMAITATATENMVTDSIYKFSHPDSVLINHDDNSMKIEVFGSEENPDYYYSYERTTASSDNEQIKESDWEFNLPIFAESRRKESKKSTFSIESGGVGFGFVNAINAPSAMDVKMASSYEIFFDHIIAVRCRPWNNGSSFFMGIGIDWKNYRMTGGARFVKDDNKLILAPYADGSDPSFSRLKIFSLTVPVMFSQDLGKHFTFNAGAVVNFNLHGSMKTKYTFDGEERTYSDDHIRQQKVTVDLMAQLNYRAIGCYIKYSPCNILDTYFGPEFNHLSAGMTLFY